jgi:hypothetical protein
MEGRFKDRERGKHVSWQLNDMKLIPKKSTKTFRFSARAQLYSQRSTVGAGAQPAKSEQLCDT